MAMWLFLGLLFFSLLVTVFMWLVPPWLWRLSQQQKQQFEQRSEHHFAASFLFLRGQEVFKLFMAVLVLLLFILWLLGGRILLVALIIFGCFLLWPMYLGMLKKRRLARFEKQFPDYLLALAGALRAGSSLGVAMQRITPLSYAPLSQEMGLLLREQRMGVSLEQALEQLHSRMPCEGSSLFKSAIAVAGQSGGGLAELFESMAKTISRRLYVEGRIRALTAQGRLQAWVMALLPALVGVALYVIDYELIAPLWQQRSGQIVLGLIVVLELFGLWLISKIVNVNL